MISLSVFFFRRVYLRWDKISTYLKESPAAIPDLHFVPWTIDRHIDEGPFLKVLCVVAFCIERHEFLLEYFVRRFWNVRWNVHRNVLCDGSWRQSNDSGRAKGQKQYCHQYYPPQFHDQDYVKFITLRTSLFVKFISHGEKLLRASNCDPIDLWRAQRYRKLLQNDDAKWLIAKYREKSTLTENFFIILHRPDDIIVSSFCYW